MDFILSDTTPVCLYETQNGLYLTKTLIVNYNKVSKWKLWSQQKKC